MKRHALAGNGGEQYLPDSQRTGEEATVFFTRDLSAEGLLRIFLRIAPCLHGKIGIKLHTGEQNGPNIIPREWVRHLMAQALPEAAIIETNSYYAGDRYTTEQHRQTLQVNGWTFAPVDILDEEGAKPFAIQNGKWFDQMYMGSHLDQYDSILALTHFKGHAMGGFGGSNKNLGIGCADGRIGKALIHTTPGQANQWDVCQEEFMECMTESTKAVLDYFQERMAFINVMRNMSVSCDCEGTAAEPVVTPDVGICASTDLLAVDQACVDLLYAMNPQDRHALVERIESRHGLRQLSYMKELGMGHDRYRLIDIDHDDRLIHAADAVSI